MTPETAISSLDNQIAQHGKAVRLVRMDGKTGNVLATADIRAIVRNNSSVSGIHGTAVMQGDTHLVISPTDLDNAGWPTAKPGINIPLEDDPRIPRTSDKIMLFGRDRQIHSVEPISLNDILVRLNIIVRGG
jgi:hypothetical protein